MINKNMLKINKSKKIEAYGIPEIFICFDFFVLKLFLFIIFLIYLDFRHEHIELILEIKF